MKNLLKIAGVCLTLFDNPNLGDPITYDSLPDEIVTDIGDDIEKFIETAEYWDKFAHHSTVKKGHKKFSYRRLIRPDVKPDEVHEMAELVAPRPTKIALATFEKSVGNYGENGEYTREDLMFHLDNTVLSLSATLKEKMRQVLDIVKGKQFISSRAIISYDTSLVNTLDNAAIIFRKNEVNRWANGYYLAHFTPEMWKKFKGEVRALGQSLDEKTKVAINGKEEEFHVYGDWMFSITTSKVLYKSATVQILVLQGRRGIDGESGVEVSKMEGYGKTEFGDNGLGDGLIYDEDGNLVNDKNKQKGSCYVNALGVGAGISDDLAILNCDVTVNEIKGSAIPTAALNRFVSKSGNEHEITASAGTKTHFVYTGARYDATASKYYANGNTILAVKVVADEGEAFSGGAAPASDNWTVTYKETSAGDSLNAEILAVVKGSVDYDTVIVRVPDHCYSFTIASAATAD